MAAYTFTLAKTIFWFAAPVTCRDLILVVSVGTDCTSSIKHVVFPLEKAVLGPLSTCTDFLLHPRLICHDASVKRIYWSISPIALGSQGLLHPSRAFLAPNATCAISRDRLFVDIAS
jgi:hypothetical protein